MEKFGDELEVELMLALAKLKKQILREVEEGRRKKDILYKLYEELPSSLLSFTFSQNMVENFNGLLSWLDRKFEELDKLERELALRFRDVTSLEGRVRLARKSFQEELNRREIELMSVEKRLQELNGLEDRD